MLASGLEYPVRIVIRLFFFFFFKLGMKMCGMEWPLGGKAKQEVKCDCFSEIFSFVWHLWEVCVKLSGL